MPNTEIRVGARIIGGELDRLLELLDGSRQLPGGHIIVSELVWPAPISGRKLHRFLIVRYHVRIPALFVVQLGQSAVCLRVPCVQAQRLLQLLRGKVVVASFGIEHPQRNVNRGKLAVDRQSLRALCLNPIYQGRVGCAAVLQKIRAPEPGIR